MVIGDVLDILFVQINILGRGGVVALPCDAFADATFAQLFAVYDDKQLRANFHILWCGDWGCTRTMK